MLRNTLSCWSWFWRGEKTSQRELQTRLALTPKDEGKGKLWDSTELRHADGSVGFLFKLSLSPPYLYETFRPVSKEHWGYVWTLRNAGGTGRSFCEEMRLMRATKRRSSSFLNFDHYLMYIGNSCDHPRALHLFVFPLNDIFPAKLAWNNQ